MPKPVPWNEKLMRWYRQNKRALPWRETSDPYAIWVSEIMLQQTRVEAVKEYYRRFLVRFPDVATLATAPEEDVLKLWEGLGYYSRARNLRKAALVAVEHYGGHLPGCYEELLRLPGIGEYTAGAIVSIAYGEAKPAVDGNVKRVIARLTGERESIDRPDVQKRLWGKVRDAIPKSDPGSFNQALMELGATLCTPRAPKCDACPLQADCDAYREGDMESLPVHEKKRPSRIVDVAVCLLNCGGKVYLFRRRERLLHGLYVFWLAQGVTAPGAIERLLGEEGIHVTYRGELGEATHVFTHLIWKMKLFHFALEAVPPENWLTENQAVLADAQALHSLPLPTAMKAAKAAALELMEIGAVEHCENRVLPTV
ncbi:MAG: A/G-specific adenine glycosylase [Eubacteriales bacterium]|nr:A/G-specific adenine glycosylase [Eubacteriales bacterium]